MGCDIHMHVERGNAERSIEWRYVMDHDQNRNYCLFARLADVRNQCEPPEQPIAKPRGLPEDLTPAVRDDAEGWAVDGHSHSWLTLDEAEQARGVNPQFDALLDYLRAVLWGPYTARLVFWFDN